MDYFSTNKDGGCVNLCLPKHEDDPYWRYKRPVAECSHESSGKGRKTVFLNVVAVADAMKCPLKLLRKFLQMDLCCIVTERKTRRVLDIKGMASGEDIERALKKFTVLFLLCPKCHIPEITWVLTDKKLTVDCAACGTDRQLSRVARAHKFHKVILTSLKPIKSKKRTKPGKQAKPGKPTKSGSPGDLDGDLEAGSDEFDWTEADDEFATDPNEWRTRWDAEFAQADSVAQKPLLQNQCVKEKLAVALRNRDYEECLKILKSGQCMDVLMEVLKTMPQSVDKVIADHIELWKSYLGDSEELCQEFLKSIEAVCASDESSYAWAPLIYKRLYDDEVVDEDDILCWFSSCSDDNVRNMIEPLVDWLQNAEEEDA